jgi:hypothetical protein
LFRIDGEGPLGYAAVGEEIIIVEYLALVGEAMISSDLVSYLGPIVGCNVLQINSQQ